MLGTFFKELRSKGISQKQVSEATGLTYGHIRKLSTGEHMPSIEVLIKLADIYKVSTDKVLGRDKCNI